MHYIASIVASNPIFLIVFSNFWFFFNSFFMFSFPNLRGELLFFEFSAKMLVPCVSMFYFIVPIFSNLTMLRAANINFILVPNPFIRMFRSWSWSVFVKQLDKKLRSNLLPSWEQHTYGSSQPFVFYPPSISATSSQFFYVLEPYLIQLFALI